MTWWVTSTRKRCTFVLSVFETRQAEVPPSTLGCQRMSVLCRYQVLLPVRYETYAEKASGGEGGWNESESL